MPIRNILGALGDNLTSAPLTAIRPSDDTEAPINYTIYFNAVEHFIGAFDIELPLVLNKETNLFGNNLFSAPNNAPLSDSDKNSNAGSFRITMEQPNTEDPVARPVFDEEFFLSNNLNVLGDLGTNRSTSPLSTDTKTAGTYLFYVLHTVINSAFSPAVQQRPDLNDTAQSAQPPSQSARHSLQAHPTVGLHSPRVLPMVGLHSLRVHPMVGLHSPQAHGGVHSPHALPMDGLHSLRDLGGHHSPHA